MGILNDELGDHGLNVLQDIIEERKRKQEASTKLILTCPNCGSTLNNIKCKLVCPNRECGYFQGCSE